MAGHGREYDDYDLREPQEVGEKNQYRAADYDEETSAEIAAPISFGRSRDTVNATDTETETAGRGMGIAALVLSIISLFVFPVLFGATGIVLGFIARRRGALSLGSWAIGIGVVSIIVGMFILPFF